MCVIHLGAVSLDDVPVAGRSEAERRGDQEAKVRDRAIQDGRDPQGGAQTEGGAQQENKYHIKEEEGRRREDQEGPGPREEAETGRKNSKYQLICQ